MLGDFLSPFETFLSSNQRKRTNSERVRCASSMYFLFSPSPSSKPNNLVHISFKITKPKWLIGLSLIPRPWLAFLSWRVAAREKNQPLQLVQVTGLPCETSNSDLLLTMEHNGSTWLGHLRLSFILNAEFELGPSLNSLTGGQRSKSNFTSENQSSIPLSSRNFFFPNQTNSPCIRGEFSSNNRPEVKFSIFRLNVSTE